MKRGFFFLVLLCVVLVPNSLFSDTITISGYFSSYPPDMLGVSGILGFKIAGNEIGRTEWEFGFSRYGYLGEELSQTELFTDYIFLVKGWNWLWAFFSAGVKVRIEYSTVSHGLVMGFGSEILAGPLFIRTGAFYNLLSHNPRQDLNLVAGAGLRI